MTSEQRAFHAVRRIIEDLRGHNGIGDEWCDLDMRAKAAIVESWERIVAEEMSREQ